MRIVRTEESKLTTWYFEIDRGMLFSVLIMIAVGMWAMLSAGSVAAERMNPSQPWYYFIKKALEFYAIGLPALFITSMLPKKWIMRFGFLDVAFCFALLLVTLVMPAAVKGSARWVNLMGFSIMPSDLMKPGFIIATAWFLVRLKKICGDDMFLSRRAWRWDGWPAYLALFLPMLGIIMLHPDLGTTLLYIGVFAAMIFIAGLPMYFLPIFGGAAALAGVFAFFTMSHVRGRILGFLGLAGGSDNYQIRKSIDAIRHGGLLGSGDDSFVKQSLPDAHTDFVYSAISEDSGALLACVLLLGFLYILKKLADSARATRDRFSFFVIAGVFALFGAQLCINLASALGLMPPKGMTLPFISYGGSSFIAFCIMFGMVIALVREDRWR